MKKIAYIEIDTHAEIAQNFMNLMKGSDTFSVDYYFSEKISNQINEKLSNVYLTESLAILEQLTGKNYDLVIIGTVHRYFDVFGEITNKFNTSIIVHNLNFLNISKSQLFVNIFKKDFVYRLKLLVKERLLSAPNVFKKAKNLLILDEGLLKQHEKLELKFLPIFYNQYFHSIESAFFTIVIPGTVSQQRRDYLHIFKALKTFTSKRKYQVVFLGKAVERELLWLKEFDKVRPENMTIRYFTEKVPSSVFDDWMQKADVLWCPIRNETEFFSQKEIYGKTKISGNIGDAIKYGKTAFFPPEYSTSYPFIVPESNDIEKQFDPIKSDKKSYFQEVNREKILQNLEKRLLNLI